VKRHLFVIAMEALQYIVALNSGGQNIMISSPQSAHMGLVHFSVLGERNSTNDFNRYDNTAFRKVMITTTVKRSSPGVSN